MNLEKPVPELHSDPCYICGRMRHPELGRQQAIVQHGVTVKDIDARLSLWAMFNLPICAACETPMLDALQSIAAYAGKRLSLHVKAIRQQVKEVKQ